MARSDPAALQALCEQGLGHHRAGRLAEAAQAYDAVLGQDPSHFDALHLLGVIYVQGGQAEPGASLLRRAVAANPSAPAAHAHLGMALWRLGRLGEALTAYDASLTLNPANADAWKSRGIVLGDLGRSGEALESFDRSLALSAQDPEAHYNRGVQLHHLKRPAEALSAQDLALTLRPAHPQAHNNRGSALIDLGRPEEALAAFDAAIALDPVYAEAHANRAIALRALKRLPQSIAAYDAALALRPADADTNLSCAMTRLLAADLPQAWLPYEWRKASWASADLAFDQGEAWTGEQALAGHTIFVHHEQGLGDTLQFARYLPLLQARGARVAFSMQPALAPLLGPALPGVEVLEGAARPAAYDFHAALLSLPLAFQTGPGDIPPPAPTLAGDPVRRTLFEALLGPRRRARVGLAWSGAASHKNDRNRSVAFARLAPLLSADTDFFAIQTEVRASDAAAFAASGRVRFLGDHLRDFADTAALMELMDVVVTVDSSPAHLAGLLGRPTFVLLPFIPDWRWLLDRADSPWYPTARLFRQPAIGDWESAVEEVRVALSVL